VEAGAIVARAPVDDERGEIVCLVAVGPRRQSLFCLVDAACHRRRDGNAALDLLVFGSRLCSSTDSARSGWPVARATQARVLRLIGLRGSQTVARARTSSSASPKPNTLANTGIQFGALQPGSARAVAIRSERAHPVVTHI
jgi:hypothetical protein